MSQDRALNVRVANGNVDCDCPHCRKRIKGFIKHSSRKPFFIVKCPRCKKSIRIDVKKDERRYFRKVVNLLGCLVQNFREESITVRDVSRGGARIAIGQLSDLKIGQEVNVSFTLDDKKNTEINVRAIVRCKDEDVYGIEFIKSGEYDPVVKNIGFYIQTL